MHPATVLRGQAGAARPTPGWMPQASGHCACTPTHTHTHTRARRFDWQGNTPHNPKTNWIKGGKMLITRIYADEKTGKFDL